MASGGGGPSDAQVDAQRRRVSRERAVSERQRRRQARRSRRSPLVTGSSAGSALGIAGNGVLGVPIPGAAGA